jgi:hypothetical protein
MERQNSEVTSPTRHAPQWEAAGVVFKLDTHGRETVLHTFTGGADGANPSANLLLDEDGNVYGTAQDGGDTSCSVPGTPLPGCGVVFKIALQRSDR